MLRCFVKKIIGFLIIFTNTKPVQCTSINYVYSGRQIIYMHILLWRFPVANDSRIYEINATTSTSVLINNTKLRRVKTMLTELKIYYIKCSAHIITDKWFTYYNICRCLDTGHRRKTVLVGPLWIMVLNSWSTININNNFKKCILLIRKQNTFSIQKVQTHESW